MKTNRPFTQEEKDWLLANELKDIDPPEPGYIVVPGPLPASMWDEFYGSYSYSDIGWERSDIAGLLLGGMYAVTYALLFTREETFPVSVAERLPTEADADESGRVLMVNSRAFSSWDFIEWDQVRHFDVTHWTRTPDLPAIKESREVRLERERDEARLEIESLKAELKELAK